MKTDHGPITVTSGVSAKTGEGFISIHWAGQAGQLDMNEARAFALSILDAVAASEIDAGIVKVLGRGKETAMLLNALRLQRGDASYSLRTILNSEEPGASDE